MEDVLVLDTAYGEGRQSFSMGGYLLYFPAENDYASSLPALAEMYHFDPWIYEFDDIALVFLSRKTSLTEGGD